LCLGANDLLVSGETIVMSGTEVLDHLCLTKKGRIVGSGDLRLTVGILYVDASSTISVDGQAGGLNTNHDCTVVSGGPDGSAAYSLTIAADMVTIEGSLSDHGGGGGDATAPAYATELGPSRKPSGTGGNGGPITLRAPLADLARLHASLDAQSGSAGKPGNDGSGTAGRTGTARNIPLSQVTGAALPEPKPLLTLAATAPVLRIGPAVSGENLPCG